MSRPSEAEVESAYEAHRATLPASNGAKPWPEAGWALQDHWRYWFKRPAHQHQENVNER